MRLLTTTFLFLIALGPLSAQSSYHEKYVSFDYDQVKLEEILLQVGVIYRINFSYSKDQIPVEQAISVHVYEVPLRTGLDALFAETKVVYTIIGEQVVLRTDPNKPLEGLTNAPESKPEYRPANNPTLRNPAVGEELDRLESREISMIEYETGTQEFPPVEIEEDEYLFDKKNWKFDLLDSLNLQAEEGHQIAQISIIPELGTNMRKEEKQINKFSVNVLWGANAGVQGVEVGGLANHISGDMDGVQLAGLYNQVDGNSTGFQAAGLVNLSNHTKAFQMAGLANISRSELTGAQLSGLFNTAGAEGDHGVQMAGLYNTNRGDVQFQAAGLFNTAREVQGVQIGLINVADTVSGVSIGLFNFVQHGYNKVEISAGEALFANVGFKMGSHAFYNILHAGLRWDQPPATGNTKTSWGLGYGIGTAAPISKKMLLNIEAVAIHINEDERWTSDLNLLNQFRLTLDHRFGKRFSVFAGGTFNVMVSNQYDPDLGRYGSNIAPYTWHDQTASNGTNVQLWGGIQAGVRF